MQVKIKKLHPDAVIPKYAKPGDAGMDITAIGRNITGNYVEYFTGLAFEIPEGYYMDIRPRSSISDISLILANSPGTSDSEYRGELKLRFKRYGSGRMYEIGERVCQIMIKPYPTIEFVETDTLSVTERGEGGFGHTNA